MDVLESRTLIPLRYHKKMDLGRGPPSDIEIMIDRVGPQTILSVDRMVWAEEIENLEETVSIKYPKNMAEYLKNALYESLIKDWNHTESLVAWLRNTFPVKYTRMSKKCVLKTRAKYPEFNYKPFPRIKFGPHIIETVSETEREEHTEE